MVLLRRRPQVRASCGGHRERSCDNSLDRMGSHLDCLPLESLTFPLVHRWPEITQEVWGARRLGAHGRACPGCSPAGS